MTRFVLTLALGLSPHVTTAGEPELDAILKRAAPFRPSPADLTYREIPWLTDPGEALAAAKSEKRPMLVWLAGGRKEDGTPLERC